MKTKYITSMGELVRKDNSLCFTNKNGHIYIPVEGIDEIYCLNEVSLNTKLLHFLSKNHIIVHFFDYYDNYSGTFFPKDCYFSGKSLVAQVNVYQDKERRLYIAKQIVKGIAQNIYEVLYHYYKHNKKEVKPTIDWIHDDMNLLINSANSIPHVMAIEGELWQRFFLCFEYILPSEFVFNKRVRRPPNNPVNALISFGNSLLYTKCINAIYQTHLNQTISFLHEPAEKRFSLSLDISETFKPILVFKTIFDLVNNKKIQVDKHFEKSLNYCILNDEGRKIFIEAFEERLNLTFQNSKLNRKMTYKTAIKMDCYKLLKYILENKEFNLFSLKDKQ